jgi:hypothetical protein
MLSASSRYAARKAREIRRWLSKADGARSHQSAQGCIKQQVEQRDQVFGKRTVAKRSQLKIEEFVHKIHSEDSD